MRSLGWKALRVLAVLAPLLACNAHAPPATGRYRGPFAGPDPDYPEINCDMNSTIDCRPVQNGP